MTQWGVVAGHCSDASLSVHAHLSDTSVPPSARLSNLRRPTTQPLEPLHPHLATRGASATCRLPPAVRSLPLARLEWHCCTRALAPSRLFDLVGELPVP